MGPDGPRHVPPKALDVLLCLAETPGELVTREQIVERVWGLSAAGESLTHCISELRHQLGDDPHRARFIETIPRRGYRLVAAAEPAPQQSFPAQHAGAHHHEDPGGRSGIAMFIDELRRRKVLRVGAVYAAAAWLIMQIAEATFAPLGIPGWAQTLVILVLLLGFPAALALAWALELTPRGLVLDAGGGHAPARRKPIDYLVAFGVLTVTALIGWQVVTRDSEAPVVADSEFPADTVEPAPNSIAVMPFVSIGTESDNPFFADGLAEELLGLLGKIDELQVAARTSSFYFRNKDNVGLPEIAKRLRVRHILEGTVRREGGSVRVRAELVDTETGFNVWQESYDRKLEDIFAIQHDIATAVVDELQLVLSGKSKARLAARATDNVQAYDLYLRAQGLRRQAGSTAALDEAVAVYEHALSLDPDFAAAHAGVCLSYLEKYERSAAISDFQSAESSCRRAIEVQGTGSEVRTALGKLYVTSGEYPRAMNEFEAAIELDAASVDAFRGLGRALTALKRFDEAERAFRRAISFEPGYWASYESLGGFYFSRGRFQEAAAAYRRLTTLRPDYANGFSYLGAAQYLQGDFQSAVESYTHSLKLAPTREAYSNTGTMYFYLGRFDAAAGMYRKAVELAPEDHRLWGNLGDARLAAGRRQQAFDAYREAIRLAEARLQVNPAETETLSPLAHYYANVGDSEQALAHLRRAVDLAPADMYVRYEEALVHTRLGDTEQALQAIEQAVELGYLPALLPTDPGLRSLSGQKRFQRLIDLAAPLTITAEGQQDEIQP